MRHLWFVEEIHQLRDKLCRDVFQDPSTIGQVQVVEGAVVAAITSGAVRSAESPADGAFSGTGIGEGERWYFDFGVGVEGPIDLLHRSREWR